MVTAIRQKVFQIVTTTLAVLVLSFSFAPLALAADYNCGAYGAGAYDEGGACGTSTTPGGDGDDGLVNTGQALAFGIPAVLILVGTLSLFKLRKSAKHRQDPKPPVA